MYNPSSHKLALFPQFGSRMANMRRVIEAGGEAQTLKRKSILKNATSHLTQHKNQPASASHFPKGATLSQRSRPVAAAVKDHSTPNQPNSGVQTKIPQFLKGKGSSSQAEARLPLGNVNGNRKLNDRLLVHFAAYFSMRYISSQSTVEPR